MFRYGFALAVGLCASTYSQAAFQIQLNGTGPGRSGNVYYSYMGSNNVQQTGSLHSVFYGQFNMTAIGQGPNGSNLAFRTFCVDMMRQMTTSYWVSQVSLAISPGSGGSFVAPMNGWLGGGMAYLYNQYLSIAKPTNDQAAQYQLAIWRLTLGEGATLWTGNSTLDSGANLLYQAALLHLDTPGSWLERLSGYKGQHVLYPEGTPVPAPGVAVLLGSGCLSLGFGRIWKRRKDKSRAA